MSYVRSGTASNGTDYANIGGTVTFNVGQATADRIVVPINDAVVEGPETVIVTLTDGANYDLAAPTSATITIADQPVPTISVAVIDGTASEAGDTGLFRFTRTGDVTLSLQFTVSSRRHRHQRLGLREHLAHADVPRRRRRRSTGRSSR